MNITFRVLTDREVKQVKRLRLTSFSAFMGAGFALLAMLVIVGLPYGMGPTFWPWAPADGYGVSLGVLTACMLIAGAVLLFALMLLHAHARLRRHLPIMQHVIPMAVGVLVLAVFGVVFVFRMGFVAWVAANEGYANGWVWSSPRGSDRILHAAFADDGQSFNVWRESGLVQTWSVGRGKERAVDAATLPGPVSLSGRAFADEKKRLESADASIEVKDRKDLTARNRDGKVWHFKQRHEVTCLALSGSGDLAFSGSKDGTVRVWNLATGVQKWELPSDSAVYCVTVSADEKTGVSGHADGSIRLWNLLTRAQRRHLKPAREANDKSPLIPVTHAVISNDGKRVVSLAGQPVCLSLWDHDRDKLVERYETTILDPMDLAVSPDGRYALIVENAAVHVVRLAAVSNVVLPAAAK